MTNDMKGAEALIRAIEEHEVEYVFGVCGDTSVGLYRAFAENSHGIQHVLARDERSAAYMADAYARLSDKPGVCEGPSGGGATYLLPGLAEANDSSIPVIAVNTTIPTRYRGRGVLTELDQGTLFDAVTKWNTVVDHAEQIPRAVRSAFREATTGRPGAVHLSLPMDVLAEETTSEIYADPATTRYPAYRSPAPGELISEASSRLEESDHPVIVAGGGVYSSRASAEVRNLAETVGIPVAQTLTGAGCVGDTPYSIGVIGENGGRAYANRIITDADTLLLLGTAVESVWTYKWTQPEDRSKTIIHADIDPATLGANYETAVALPGDVRETLRSLLRHVEPAEKWSAAALANTHSQWMAKYEPAFESDEFPLHPERMVAGANAVLDNDAIIVSDPGTSCPYFAAFYRFTEEGRHWVTPRAHGALGYAVPGVVGAYFANPETQIIGFTGDGSLGTTMGELETLSRYDIPVTVVVVNNAAFSWIEAGQQNYAEFSFAVDFQGLDYAAIAEHFGIAGYRVENTNDYEHILATALNTQGPALVDLPTQPLPTLENPPVDWLEPEA